MAQQRALQVCLFLPSLLHLARHHAESAQFLGAPYLAVSAKKTAGEALHYNKDHQSLVLFYPNSVSLIPLAEERIVCLDPGILSTLDNIPALP